MRRSGFPLLCFFCFFCWASCTPPTCYSRLLGLSKEIMEILEKVHKYERTKSCAEVLPKMFLDIHNSCIRTKLRDFQYVVENIPYYHCHGLPRIIFLKRKVNTIYNLITRACYRDLVYLTDDCEALDTGYSSPRYSEDRLQLLEEAR